MTYEEYSKFRDAKGVSDYKVSQETGVSRATLSEWKNGKYQPKAEKIAAIKEYLGIVESFPAFEPEHIELISLYSKLNEEQKKQALQYLKFLALQE